MRLSSFASFLVPSLLFATAAHAEARAELSWTRSDGADECATRAQIARRVAKRLGRDPFVSGPTEGALTLEGVVDRAPGGAYRARIYAEPPSCARGECARVVRELVGDADSCASLDGAVVLALALTIDPTALAAPDPGSPKASIPPPPPAPASSTGTADVLPRREVPISHGREGLHAGFVARATLLGNVLPSPSMGAGLEGHVRLGRYARVLLGGLVQPEMRDGSYAFGLSAGSAGACFGVGFGGRESGAEGDRLWIAACGRALVGGMHAVVYRLEPTEPGQRLWAAATFGASAELRLAGPFGLEASAFALTSLVRPRFFVSGTNETVFTVPAAGGGGSLGLFARF